MKGIMVATGALLILFIFGGCSESEQKLTTSMLRRQAADEAHSEAILKASALLTPSVKANPASHLDEITMTYRHIHDAKTVYRQAKITSWDKSKFRQLQNDLKNLNKPLALESLSLIDQMITRSIAFKRKKKGVETLPVTDNSVAKQALYNQLAIFNREITSCCTENINYINQLLSSEKNLYYDVMKFGHNATYHMGRLIRDEVTEQSLREEVTSLRSKVRSQSTDQPSQNQVALHSAYAQ